MTLTYKDAACYELFRPADGVVLGRIRRGVYQVAGEAPCTLQPYTGTVCELDGRLAIKLRSAGVLGYLDGLQVMTDEGECLQLRQVRRPADWRSLDDPDAYRAFRDFAMFLEESGQARPRPLELKLAAAPFDPCPECNDHYGFAEDCPRCSGRGFVPEI
ncbi:hypothetical protein ACMYUJ_17230 [Stutzerimonas zhaodongensis]|uniref:hypothetical protein n=1 Tax=Stutzerimonas zhaodongensis TaxID=1176257 RepID=UPI0039F048B1